MKLTVKTSRQWTEPDQVTTHEPDEVATIDTDKVFDHQDLLDQGVISIVEPAPEPARFSSKRGKDVTSDSTEEGSIE